MKFTDNLHAASLISAEIADKSPPCPRKKMICGKIASPSKKVGTWPLFWSGCLGLKIK